MEIHHADKGYRRRSAWTLIGVLLLLAILLWHLNAWLQGLDVQLSNSDPASAKHWLRALMA
ncbi:MAG: hypothetical protein NDI59_06235, partial [Lysobacter sp.]|nr:hypothetical protein [Lysobacter sp.]